VHSAFPSGVTEKAELGLDDTAETVKAMASIKTGLAKLGESVVHIWLLSAVGPVVSMARPCTRCVISTVMSLTSQQASVTRVTFEDHLALSAGNPSANGAVLVGALTNPSH